MDGTSTIEEEQIEDAWTFTTLWVTHLLTIILSLSLSLSYYLISPTPAYADLRSAFIVSLMMSKVQVKQQRQVLDQHKQATSTQSF